MKFEEGLHAGDLSHGVTGARVDDVGVVGAPSSAECFFVLVQG